MQTKTASWRGRLTSRYGDRGSLHRVACFKTRLGLLCGGPCDSVLGYSTTPVVILAEEYCSNWPETHCYPIRDYSVEPLENLVKAVEEAVRLLRGRGGVAVCCSGGCGRTGTVVSTLLALLEGVDCHEAMAMYSRERGMECPETPEQREAVCRLSRELKRRMPGLGV